MGACSSAELEPGPIALLDEDTAIGPPEPPTFTPIAHEFASRLPAFYTAFDESIAALVVEQSVDLGGSILDGLGAVTAHTASAVNPEALANLQAAEDGFRVARDKTASLKSWVPEDIQQPSGFYVLDFIVSAADGTRLPGALVQIDADFGSGSTRSTDGNGIAILPVGVDATVAYTITAAGFAVGSGVVRATTTFVPVRVTLQAA